MTRDRTLITILLPDRRLEIVLETRSEGEAIDLVAEEDLDPGPWHRLSLGGVPLRWRAVEGVPHERR
ncbi:MAG: hypothetical protein R3B09_20180 [Nannocystaceae bacterium]